MCLSVETGGTRVDDGKQLQFPQVFLDVALRAVVIAGRYYPMERVVSYKRAKMALNKMPPITELPDYTIRIRK